MYHEQHGGGKPLKKLPSDFKLMMTKDGKIFFGNKKFVKMKRIVLIL